jgi:uncharacterized protein (TIGR02246 family)
MNSSDAAALAERVARLEARNEITELVTAYAVACDVHDIPALSALFTPDAEFDSPSGLMVAKGREAIAGMFVALFRVRGPAYHWTHDVIVRMDRDDPDRAQGVVYSHAETTPNSVVSLAAMRYDDQYLRRDGEWRFRRRTISFLYYVPAAEYPDGLNRTDRLVFGDRRLSADYPETLASWRDFEQRHLSGV